MQRRAKVEHEEDQARAAVRPAGDRGRCEVSEIKRQGLANLAQALKRVATNDSKQVSQESTDVITEASEILMSLAVRDLSLDDYVYRTCPICNAFVSDRPVDYLSSCVQDPTLYGCDDCGIYVGSLDTWDKFSDPKKGQE